MIGMLKERLGRWKASPRKWTIPYIWSGLKGVFLTILQDYRLARKRKKLLTPAIEAEYVNMLFDPEFKSSLALVSKCTCLDVARLANLWNLARLSGPGIFLEVGSFQGGTALHICNAIEHRDVRFYCFDPFEKGGFEKMTDLDKVFKASDFTTTRFESVVALLSSKPNAKVIQGFFPSAAEGLDLHDIAFCHLDVDVYDATKQSLEYLAPRLAPRGLIVVDDFDHIETPGVNKAVAEFLAAHPSFIMIPMFPVQAVLLPKSLW
jgi:predicted O-methyltransferase YrrM